MSGCMSVRLLIIAMSIIGIASCGGSTTSPIGPSSDAGTMLLTSSEFVDRGTFPAKFTCDGVGTSPPLGWSNAPANTAEFALLMTTIAPNGTKWNWVLVHIPATTNSLPANDTSIGVAGLTSDGPLLAYSPPCSQGPGAKSYTFTLYALSSPLTTSVPNNQLTGSVVTNAIANSTLATGSLTVTYTRP
jgi:phosphatidylethanolamine-binding protein (PEBP) family uncharacterized protein